MIYIKKRLSLFLALLIFWFILNLNFQLETIILGLIVAILVTIFSYPVLYDERGFRYRGLRLDKMILYFFVLFFEIFKSAFIYTRNLFSKEYVPTVFTIELDVKDPMQVGIVANSITLTPGTISVETTDNKIIVLTLAKKGTTQEELERPIRNQFERFFRVKEGK